MSINGLQKHKIYFCDMHKKGAAYKFNDQK